MSHVLKEVRDGWKKERLARSLAELMQVEIPIPDYTSLETKKIRVIIPPRRNAKIKRHGNSSQSPLPRDQAIREIRRKGRKAWKEKVGYHRRRLSETAMHRVKCCFGNKLKNHLLQNQRTETRLRSRIARREWGSVRGVTGSVLKLARKVAPA